jgi:predicted RNase H-like nuclease (RuvC/YqgF family)
MQELQLLNEKLDLLLKKYTALQAENKRLKDTVSQQLKSIEMLNGKLSSLEDNMQATQIGKAVINTDEKAGVRKQIDNVISEIDKILNTLND